MGFMKELLEQRLDRNKYDMYELLLNIKEQRYTLNLQDVAELTKILNKIERGENELES